MQQFLDDADPIEWFVTAQTINPDGAGLLEWMAAHPRLDRATALALFWHSQPGYHQAFAAKEEVPDVNRSGWQVIHRLKEHLTGGDLADHGIAFDPTDDAGYDWTSEARTDADAAWQVPEELFRALPGAEIDADDWANEHEWEDGLPPVVYEVLEEAFDDDGDDDWDDDEDNEDEGY